MNHQNQSCFMDVTVTFIVVGWACEAIFKFQKNLQQKLMEYSHLTKVFKKYT